MKKEHRALILRLSDELENEPGQDRTEKEKKMDRERRAESYREALELLELTPASQRTAKAIGVMNVRRAQRFHRAETDIPDSVFRLLRMYLEHGLTADVQIQDES